MTSTNWSQIAAEAATAPGFGPQHPEGSDYVGEIVKAGVTNKQGKNASWWFDVSCLVGPAAGKKDRLFQTYAPASGTSVGIWFRLLDALGINLGSFPDGTPSDDIAKSAVGRRINYTIKHKEWNGKQSAEFLNVKLVDGGPIAQVPVAPVVPTAPVPAAVEAAPAAPAAGPSVEELQAQLAALSAAAAAPAAAAPAASGLPF